MSIKIGQYLYTYSAGYVPNRRIEFKEDATTRKITADIFAKIEHRQWYPNSISQLTENDIWIDQSEKNESMPSMNFSQLDLKTKKSIIQALQPEGPFDLLVYTTTGEEYYEKITKLCFYRREKIELT